MRVLVLGANGFIGSAVVAALERDGMEVRCVVRDGERTARRFPRADVRLLDLTSSAARDPGTWAGMLDGVDAVVNAAGVLQPRRAAEAWRVHRDAPSALYRACETAGVRRVVHVSATGIVETGTTYARSKRAGEASLMARGLDWTVLRPALVVGEDAWGGSSLLRAIAAFPFATPVIGDGKTPVDVIHKDDLAAGIVVLLRTGRGARSVLEPAGAPRLSLSDVVSAYRGWLGLPDRPILRVPMRLASFLARLGDVARLHPLTSTALAQFRARLTGDAAGFEEVTGIGARSLPEILSHRPSGSQDLWHARLFLLRPFVRMSLALLWAVSGVLGLLAEPAAYESVLEPLTSGGAREIALAASAVDLGIAAALLAGWRPKLMARVQIAMVAGYTAALGLLAPGLWLDLYGGLLKNVPVLVLILVHRILEEER